LAHWKHGGKRVAGLNGYMGKQVVIFHQGEVGHVQTKVTGVMRVIGVQAEG
jgi:hypothetical protein